MKKFKRFAALLSAAAVSATMSAIPASAMLSSGNDPVAQMLAGMTTKQKIEQMIMITFRPWENTSVTSLNSEQKQFIESHNFGGICLFADNIQSTSQCVGLTSQIQQASLNSDCGIPMIISTDQEGGIIYRLTTGTPTCGNMALGATGDPSLAEENAKIIGSELAALGINNDFAPVMDVNNNPSNPIINIRSFSSDPSAVSSMGTRYIKGLHSTGVTTTCKHFPGHGDTDVDSHTGLPLINKTYDQLKKMELMPYNSDVLSSTDMIMTAHIQFPQIETATYTSKADGSQIYLPATLSKTIITDILRGDLKYDGVVTTDAMLMDAIKVNFDPIDAAVLAINADVDILLEPMYIQNSTDIANMEKYIDNIAKQVENGRISIDTIDRSVKRILKMKKDRGILNYKVPNADNAKKIVGSDANREKALQIAEKAVTLIKNDNNILPLKTTGSTKVAYFYPYANVENTMGFALDRLKKDGVIPNGVTAECIWHRYHNASEYISTIRNSDYIILSFEMYTTNNLDKNNADRGWQTRFADDLIDLAHKNGKKVIFLSANIPYDISRFTKADAIVASYCANGMSSLPVSGKENTAYGENYPAALITIFGGNKPTGKLPVDVYSINANAQFTNNILYSRGYGLTYSERQPDPPTASTTTTSIVTTSQSGGGSSALPPAGSSSTSAVNSNGMDSPKTGRNAPALAILGLIAACSAAFVCRRKDR